MTLRSSLTSTLVVGVFVLFWGFVWIWSSGTESLSWVVWASLLAPVVFWTAYIHEVTDADQRSFVAGALLVLAVGLWIGGGVGYGEWGSDRGPTATSAFLAVALLTLIAAPVAIGATIVHTRLSTALAGVLLGQAIFVVLAIIFPNPTVISDGVYGKDSIATAVRVAVVVLGAAGALLLAGAGMLLRSHVPLRVTWPAAGAFFLAAVIYQVWYPPFSTWGD